MDEPITCLFFLFPLPEYKTNRVPVTSLNMMTSALVFMQVEIDVLCKSRH